MTTQITFVERVMERELGTGDMVLVNGDWKRVAPGNEGVRVTEDGDLVYGSGPDYLIARIPGPVLEALRQGALQDPYR